MADLLAPKAADLQQIGVAAYPTPGQGLALDQTGKIPQNVGVALVRNKEFSVVDVASTASESSLSNSLVVANSLGATGGLILTLFGDMLFNRNVADTLTMRIKFGGTIHYDFTANVNQSLSAVRRPWKWEVLLANTGAVNTQFLTSEFNLSASNLAGTTTTGIGSLGANILNNAGTSGALLGGIGASNGTMSIDTAQDQFLVVTVQWSASSSSNSFRKFYSVLEIF